VEKITNYLDATNAIRYRAHRADRPHAPPGESSGKTSKTQNQSQKAAFTGKLKK